MLMVRRRGSAAVLILVLQMTGDDGDDDDDRDDDASARSHGCEEEGASQNADGSCSGDDSRNGREATADIDGGSRAEVR